MSDWSATVAFFRILLVMCLPIAEARAMQVATGSFSGDGTTSQAITGLGFAPEVVILRTLGAGNSTRFRSATMLTGSKTLIENAALEGGWITSLDSDGFTVGDAARINDIGWESHWIAFTGTDDGFAVGSYIGDGASTDVDISDTSSSPDFQPSYLILVADTGIAPVQRFDDGTDSSSHLFGFTGAPVSGGNVTDFTPTGFNVTSGDRTNASGIDYHYVAWRERDGTEVGTYTGHGVGGATIPVPFPPSFASISRGICCVQSIFRIGSQIADQSSFYSPIDEVDDGIKSFTAGGFVIGDHASVASAQKHFFVAFGSATSPVPAISAGLLALLAVAIAVAGATYRVHQA
jgi:hypothetical protein